MAQIKAALSRYVEMRGVDRLRSRRWRI